MTAQSLEPENLTSEQLGTLKLLVQRSVDMAAAFREAARLLDAHGAGGPELYSVAGVLRTFGSDLGFASRRLVQIVATLEPHYVGERRNHGPGLRSTWSALHSLIDAGNPYVILLEAETTHGSFLEELGRWTLGHASDSLGLELLIHYSAAQALQDRLCGLRLAAREPLAS